MITTWSDEDSNDDRDDVKANVVTSLKDWKEEDFSDEEISKEELVEINKFLYEKMKESCDIINRQKNNILDLTQDKEFLAKVNIELQEEVSMLKSKFDRMNKSICMLNNATNVLDQILEGGK